MNDTHKAGREVFEFLSLDGNDFTSDSIVLLLGAGASIDAGVPTLNGIIKIVEDKLAKNVSESETQRGIDVEYNMATIRLNREKRKQSLFLYLKRKCISLNYSQNSSANVEEILALIKDIIALKDNNHLYNVIGEWEKELIEASRDSFELLKELRDTIESIIIGALKLEAKGLDGKVVEEGEDADKILYERLKYLNFIFYLHRKAGGVLNIFTLNHDVAIEEAFRLYCQYELFGKFNNGVTQTDLLTNYNELARQKAGWSEVEEGVAFSFPGSIETGFADKFVIEGNRLLYEHQNKQRDFNTDNYKKKDKEKYGEKEVDDRIKLYKLHGSVNWHRNISEDRIQSYLTSEEQSHQEKGDETEIIFGVSQKYKSEEPYSTLYHNFKEKLKEPGVRLLVVVGYAFNDMHINNAIDSALKSNPELKLVVSDPNVSETYFFSHSSVIDAAKAKSAKSMNSLEKIMKTRTYEEYLNVIDALYPAFYVRNYDEDALFLALCNFQRVENKLNGVETTDELNNNYINYTKIAREGAFWLETLFKDDIQKGEHPISLASIANGFSKEDFRNGALYGKIFSQEDKGKKGQVRYAEAIKQITNLKAILYSNWKRVRSERPVINDGREDPKDKTTKEGIERLAELRGYERCFLELREDLTVIQTFIEKIIPVHIYLIFFYIEKYNRALDVYKEAREMNGREYVKQSLASVKALSLTVLELFLKYHYFTDVIKIHLVNSGDRQRYIDVLKCGDNGNNYPRNFAKMVDELWVIDSDYSLMVSADNAHEKINVLSEEERAAAPNRGKEKHKTYDGVLKEINQFLYDVRDAIVSKQGKDKTARPFGGDFFTLKDELKRDPNANLNFLMKNVLHKKEEAEKDTCVKVELYTKAVCKSIINRLHYKDRLLIDLFQLVSVSDDGFIANMQEGNVNRKGLTVKSKYEKYFETVDALKLKNHEQSEVYNRLGYNVNSYLRKEYKNLLNNLNFTYSLTFEKYIENMRFMHRLSGKSKSKTKFSDIENSWKKCIVERMETDAAERKTNKEELFKFLSDFKDSDRIIFRHFKAKLFFSKEFRILNMYKYYHSTFDEKTHLEYFNNVNELVKQFVVEMIPASASSAVNVSYSDKQQA